MRKRSLLSRCPTYYRVYANISQGYELKFQRLNLKPSVSFTAVLLIMYRACKIKRDQHQYLPRGWGRGAGNAELTIRDE